MQLSIFVSQRSVFFPINSITKWKTISSTLGRLEGIHSFSLLEGFLLLSPQSQWNYFCKMRKPSVGEVNGAIKRKEGAFWVAVTTQLFYEQCFLRSPGLPGKNIEVCNSAMRGEIHSTFCDIFQNLLAQLVCHQNCSDFRQSQRALFAYCILPMHTALLKGTVPCILLPNLINQFGQGLV